MIKLPLDSSQGWGGKGRVTLVGDAAHAMRPSNGMGASMAFEDVVVLCRCLAEEIEKTAETGAIAGSDRKSPLSMASTLRRYETSRYDRVKRIWDMEWEVAESAYRKERIKLTPEFHQWVMEGV